MAEAVLERLPLRGDETVVCASLTELALDQPVDAAFSNAVFHWIADHERLFERLFAALRAGGRLVAQCGGKGNIDAFRRLADEVAGEPPYADHMCSSSPARSASATTSRRCRRSCAGATPRRSCAAWASRSCSSTCG
ncbi:MAG: methyltransferase domain-containing protein [Thermoleophilaceae bacterium]|nr:methyltransferase domain-containing protein [Thermoleophilaceae bacterium]